MTPRKRVGSVVVDPFDGGQITIPLVSVSRFQRHVRAFRGVAARPKRSFSVAYVRGEAPIEKGERVAARVTTIDRLKGEMLISPRTGIPYSGLPYPDFSRVFFSL